MFPFPPDAPGGLTAVVQGSTVALNWSIRNLLGASFIVEAGSASGLANLANLVTGTSALSLVVPGVPVGTYVVRVRGISACGAGLASSDVVVIVGSN